MKINDRIGDALNRTIYYRGGWLDIRALDLITVLGGIFCVAYYYCTGGWLAAAQGGMLYLFIALCITWFFPSSKEMK